MSDVLQLVIVSTAAAGAFAVIARPLWRKRYTPPASATPAPSCDKCAAHDHPRT